MYLNLKTNMMLWFQCGILKVELNVLNLKIIVSVFVHYAYIIRFYEDTNCISQEPNWLQKNVLKKILMSVE